MIWKELFDEEFSKPYMKKLASFVTERRKVSNVYPESKNVFKAFDLCPFDNVKVIIIGQDPYHTKNVAHGLAFSSARPDYIPPSLEIIFKEIGCTSKADLTSWAEQGVLLLNRILTVEGGYPLTHSNKGWETFTEHIIKMLGETSDPKVFLLWGTTARAVRPLINERFHYVLEAVHPITEIYHRTTGGFIGCKHFEKTNEILKSQGKKIIKWDN